MPDLATLIGMLGACGLVFFAVLQGEGGVDIFINIPSIAIVLGGSAFVALMKFGLADFLGSFKVGFKAFFYKQTKITDQIEIAVRLANKARREGVLSLEEEVIADPFLKKGVEYLVDGHPGQFIKSALTKEMYQAMERHDVGIKFFKAVGDVGPAMGMIGTLVGLVQMLSNMEDPKSIGPAMAVALLTTLYGAMLANMFAIPIADKLGLRNSQERITKMLYIDAVLAIQQEERPRLLEESLKPYLARSKRDGDKEAA